jgi:hypothetical protein
VNLRRLFRWRATETSGARDPSPARASWPTAPPLPLRVEPPALITAPDRFAASLASWQDPSCRGTIGHFVSAEAPSGSSQGVATVREPGPVRAWSRRATATLQRSQHESADPLIPSATATPHYPTTIDSDSLWPAAESTPHSAPTTSVDHERPVAGSPAPVRFGDENRAGMLPAQPIPVILLQEKPIDDFLAPPATVPRLDHEQPAADLPTPPVVTRTPDHKHPADTPQAPPTTAIGADQQQSIHTIAAQPTAMRHDQPNNRIPAPLATTKTRLDQERSTSAPPIPPVVSKTPDHELPGNTPPTTTIGADQQQSIHTIAIQPTAMRHDQPNNRIPAPLATTKTRLDQERSTSAPPIPPVVSKTPDHEQPGDTPQAPPTTTVRPDQQQSIGTIAIQHTAMRHDHDQPIGELAQPTAMRLDQGQPNNRPPAVAATTEGGLDQEGSFSDLPIPFGTAMRSYHSAGELPPAETVVGFDQRYSIGSLAARPIATHDHEHLTGRLLAPPTGSRFDTAGERPPRTAVAQLDQEHPGAGSPPVTAPPRLDQQNPIGGLSRPTIGQQGQPPSVAPTSVSEREGPRRRLGFGPPVRIPEVGSPVGEPVVWLQRAENAPEPVEASADSQSAVPLEAASAPTLPAQTSAPIGLGGGSTSPTDIDTLVGRIYDPIVRRLKAELGLDRERAGRGLDLRL